MAERLLRLLRTAYQVVASAVIVLVIFMVPLCMSGGTLFRVDMLTKDQVLAEIGSGGTDRFAHIEVDLSTGAAKSGGGPEYFGEESKLAGEYEIAPTRVEAQPIGTAAAKAALQKSYGPVRSRGGPAVGRGAGGVTDYARDDGSDRERRIAEAAARRAAGRKCDDPLPGIRHGGGDTYSVDRSVVEYFTSDISAVQQVVGVRWYRSDDGRVEGFQVGNIRCGSPLAQLGIRNGDVVHRINGRPVRSLLAAMGALRSLRRNDRVHVELTRRGTPFERFVQIL